MSHFTAPLVPQQLDVVRFLVPVQGWPEGTTGTLLMAYSTGGVVEVGHEGEEVSVYYDDVEVVWSARQEGIVAAEH